jgi:hypothetical protein
LKQFSKTYPSVISAIEIARGGEAVIYRVEHTALDEIVVKCPVFPDNATQADVTNSYASIFYES